MSDFRKHLDKSLEDETFKKEWDNLELRYAVVEQLIKLRNAYDLSQTELAKKIEINII